MVGHEINSSGRAQVLRNSGVHSHHAPCAQVFGNRSDVEPLTEAAIDAEIGSGQVIFKMHRRELLIARPPACYQGSLSPWRTYAKVDCGAE